MPTPQKMHSDSRKQAGLIQWFLIQRRSVAADFSAFAANSSASIVGFNRQNSRRHRN
ncbi:MAG TPA: hypothetical protein V6D10_19820 [Trichocoleus sp.]